jgi:hypothetical protein
MEINLGDDIWDIGAAVQAAVSDAVSSGAPVPVYDEDGRRVALITPCGDEEG